MIDFDLAVMVLAPRDNVAYITTFHSIIAVIVHQFICSIHILFVVHHRRRGFVMHHQLYAFSVCIGVKRLDIKVGIGGKKVENLLFQVTLRIFPADVPALDQYLVEPVFGSKIDITAHISVVGGMSSGGFALL